MTAWHLDALDARAGLAFASNRDADLSGDLLDMQALAVFIAAPDFTPETLASRATGLAATRGSLQLGLFLEEGEVAFATLDDVVEFVRRCYLAGGGGDGAAGTGPGVPPLGPDGAEGETPLDPGPFVSAAAQPIQRMFWHLDEMAHNQRLSFETTGRGARLVRVASASTSCVSAPSGPASDLLTLGAAAALIEMLRRCPPPGGDLGVWWQGLQCLGDAADRLGLWGGFAGPDFAPTIAEEWEGTLRRRPHLLGDRLGDDVPMAFETLFLGLARGDRRRRGDGDEPFEDLARLPLPAGTARRLELPVRNASLADLVSLATAAPATFAGSKPVDAGLLLFAACHLLRNRGSAPVWGNGEIATSWREALVGSALAWLRQNLPERIFPVQIEAMIARAREPRYA